MKKIKDIGKHLPKVSQELVAKALGVEMNTYSFSIYFDTTESYDYLVEKLYEAGCDDSLVGVCDGIHCIDFDRESTSINEAIKSAIENIISSGLEIRVTSITVIPPAQCIVPGCKAEAIFCSPDDLCDNHWNEWWNWDDSNQKKISDAGDRHDWDTCDALEMSKPDWMKNLDKKVI